WSSSEQYSQKRRQGRANEPPRVPRCGQKCGPPDRRPPRGHAFHVHLVLHPSIVVFTELCDLHSTVQRSRDTICFTESSKQCGPTEQSPNARVWESSRRLYALTTRHATARLLTVRRLQAHAMRLARRAVAGELCCKTKSCCACSRPRAPFGTGISSSPVDCTAAHTCSAR